MSIDLKTIKHISKLSRISVNDTKAEKLADDLNAIFKFIEKLNELKTEKIKPLTSVAETPLKLRTDEVKSENIREDIYIKAKSKVAEQRLSMRDILEESLSLYLDISTQEDDMCELKDSVWGDTNICIQVNEPLGSPVDVSEEDARRIAREAFQ